MRFSFRVIESPHRGHRVSFPWAPKKKNHSSKRFAVQQWLGQKRLFNVEGGQRSKWGEGKCVISYIGCLKRGQSERGAGWPTTAERASQRGFACCSFSFFFSECVLSLYISATLLYYSFFFSSLDFWVFLVCVEVIWAAQLTGGFINGWHYPPSHGSAPRPWVLHRLQPSLGYSLLSLCFSEYLSFVREITNGVLWIFQVGWG